MYEGAGVDGCLELFLQDSDPPWKCHMFKD